MKEFNPSSRKVPEKKKLLEKGKKKRTFKNFAEEELEQTLKILSSERKFYKKTQKMIALVFLMQGLIIGIIIGVFLL